MFAVTQHTSDLLGQGHICNEAFHSLCTIQAQNELGPTASQQKACQRGLCTPSSFLT